MALVGVEDLGRGVPGDPAERPHRAHPADAQQHLLEQPVLAAAAVQPVGDVPFAGRVGRHVGVEQQQRHPPDLGSPDLRGEPPPGGQCQLDPGRGAVGLAQQGDGQLLRVEHRVALLLPAVPAERLAEVAVPVEQPDPDQRHPEVAGGLEVVAGQDAQAAGVLRQRGGDAVLRREVGDGGRQRLGARGRLVPARRAQVVGQVVGEVAEAAQEAAVAGQCGERRAAPRRAGGPGPRRRPPRLPDRPRGTAPGSPGARTSAG